MSKLKVVIVLLVFFGLYKGYVAFTNFEIGVSDKVAKLEEVAQIEKQEEVVALLMYLGDPLKLTEHLFVKGEEKCSEMKQMAEESSYAFYQCAVVDAVLVGRKIVKVNKKLKVF
mgnify:CR=1 FL=1